MLRHLPPCCMDGVEERRFSRGAKSLAFWWRPTKPDRRCMKLWRAHIVLIDISGYTQFIRLHRLSLIHAERIVTDLLDSVIDASQPPLKLNKLEGDAALFYAVIEDGADAESQRRGAAALLRQLEGFFAVFQARERELVSECSLCTCDACVRAGDLRLKIIVHTGTVLVKQMRQFEEIAGEDVIVAHRLLKNSVPADEYLLLTEPFHSLAGAPQSATTESFVEKWEGETPMRTHVRYLSQIARPPNPPTSLWRKLKAQLRLDAHIVRRIFRKPDRAFHHLPTGKRAGREGVRGSQGSGSVPRH